MVKLGKILLLLVTAVIVVGCGSRLNPETRMYTVYGTSKFKLPEGYEKVGNVSVNVEPQTWESGAFPYQTFNTTVFGQGESYILSQTMNVSGNRYFVRPLKGSTASRWGTGWRSGSYQLDTGNTSLEYRRYLDYIKSTGHPVAPGYKVDVYDRLIGRKVIARVMVLSPDKVSGRPPAPEARDLYTLDRDDFRSR
ncbi:hypothetical protein [Halodesulfovibrio spirochaetisodalis]|uniref:Uncharacterized protein n=1 Tax=Halodesulfovibrio spirochaetisodalis TaxID=1560234 RepID=A0A1B7XE21_9BACT|nr:hypothetical protein [Halodesulfovibrio spirochaetisodalis]OBQ52405.1 hypothetical protein SP90_07460 [Halodesulfovibrio spirochaetisodalis]